MATKVKTKKQNQNRKASGKEKRDIVNISIDKNSIRLDICSKASRDFWGKSQHRIYIGLPDTLENRTKAEEIKSLLKRDILWREVDTTDEKYKVFSQTKTESLVVEPTFYPLLNLYDEHCEKKRPTLAETTYVRNYRGSHLALFKKMVSINPTVDIRNSSQILELSKKVTKSPYYSRFILSKCGEMMDSLIATGKLPPETINPYTERLLKEIPGSCSRQKSKKMQDKGYIGDADTRAYTIEQWRTILEELKKIGDRRYKDEKYKGRWYPYVAFLLFTGCRPGEASGLLWRDVDRNFETITFRRSWDATLKKLKPLKTESVGGEPVVRVFPCTTELKQLLKSIKPENCNLDSHVFLDKGKPVNRFSLEIFWLGKGSKKGFIEKLAEKEGSGINIYLKPYSSRHTFITQQLALGNTPADVAYWVGNSPKTIYENYVSRQPNSRPSEILTKANEELTMASQRDNQQIL
jgi:integrase